MVICKGCNGRCDSGDIEGGKCYTCREEERQKQIRADAGVRIMNSPSYQMGLDLTGCQKG